MRTPLVILLLAYAIAGLLFGWQGIALLAVIGTTISVVALSLDDIEARRRRRGGR